jgi:hypothetical protein
VLWLTSLGGEHIPLALTTNGQESQHCLVIKMVHSKVRHLLYDGDGQLVPRVREQTGEQLLHHLAGQGAAGHLHEVTGQ